jgi:type IV pilus assembly protein PilN
MIKINLLVEARAEKVPKAPLITFGTAGLNNLILLGLLVAGLVYGGIKWYSLNSQIETLNRDTQAAQREYERLKPIIAEVEAFKKRNAELKRKIEVIEALKAGQYGPVRIMDEVSKALPDLVWLNSLNLAGSLLTLRGQALNENAVANFITNLGSSPFFSEPTLGTMSQDEQGVFSFDLTVNFSRTPRESPVPAPRAQS